MNSSHLVQTLVDQLGLERHPEGGWFRENYRSDELIPASGLPARFGAGRSIATAIYFLLESGDFSALHRIKSDEIWHHYGGSPLLIHCIDPVGGYQALHLGPDMQAGQRFQLVVKAGCWFGAEPLTTGYTLVGCTVAPGFDFADFELAERSSLKTLYPQHGALIERLTRH